MVKLWLIIQVVDKYDDIPQQYINEVKENVAEYMLENPIVKVYMNRLGFIGSCVSSIMMCTYIQNRVLLKRIQHPT